MAVVEEAAKAPRLLEVGPDFSPKRAPLKGGSTRALERKDLS